MASLPGLAATPSTDRWTFGSTCCSGSVDLADILVSVAAFGSRARTGVGDRIYILSLEDPKSTVSLPREILIPGLKSLNG